MTAMTIPESQSAGLMDDGLEHLRGAYERTVYRVLVSPGPGFAIRCGARSPEADALLAAAGADEWAFVTACNPRSTRLTDADNATRMERLTAAVRARRLVAVPGAGSGADGDWPPEPSLFVVGLAEREAVALAREFDQFAIVTGRRGEPARLVWVDAAPPA